MVCQAALRLDPYPTYDDNLNRCLYGDNTDTCTDTDNSTSYNTLLCFIRFIKALECAGCMPMNVLRIIISEKNKVDKIKGTYWLTIYAI